MKKINIAIDGPSAAGKSTISKTLAKKLNYVHLDTGAMYRCVAYKALNNDIALDDEDKLSEMLDETSIRMTPEGEIFLDDENVSLAIREDEISNAASTVSKVGVVREKLVALQQELAKEKGIIMDGRDIGTVVLKDAELKIYLTASAEARAMRRYKQNEENGQLTNDYETILADIKARDEQDMNREISPLRKADDAIEIDSSDLEIDEVVDKALELVEPLLED